MSEDALAAAQAKVDSAQAELSTAQEKQQKAEDALSAANSSVSTAEADLAKANSAAAAKEEAATDAQITLDAAKKAATAAENNLTSAKAENAAAIEAKQHADEAVAAAQAEKEKSDATVKQAKLDKTAADSAVSAAQAEVDRINSEIDDANEQAKQGSLGFVNWMLSQENLTDEQKNDLERAKQVIEKATVESFDKYAYGDRASFMPEERNNMVTVIGDEKDATSLANLKKSIGIMKKINELRASDDNFVGDMKRNPSLTNFYFMAVAQTGADRGAGLHAHSLLQVNCENLAFGYTDDPTIGWYKKEKRTFDQIKGELGITEINEATLQQIKAEAKARNVEVGHYTNLFWAADQLMGVGFTQYRTTACYNASYLSNYQNKYSKYASYTIDEFEAFVNAYQAHLDNPGGAVSLEQQLAAAKAALDQVKAKQKEANETLSAKEQAATTAQQNVEQAQTKQAEAQSAIEVSEQSISEKQKAIKNAQDAVTQAIQALNEANAQLEQAKSDAFAKQQALAAAKEDVSAAEANLAAAKGETKTAQSNKDAADEELAGLSAKLAQAQKAYDAALTARESAVAKQNEAAGKLNSAESDAANAAEALKQAEANAEAKQGEAAKAEQQVADASSELLSAQGEFARLNCLALAVEQAQDEADNASTSAADAKLELDTANAAIPAAEAAVSQREQESAALADTLAAAKAINANDAYESGIADTRFADLDALYAAAREAQSKADAAKAVLEAAEQEVGRHSEHYVEALLNYQEAAENLRAAQAAYDAALAKELAEQEAANQAGSANNAANPTTTPAKLQLNGKQTNTSQANSASPKTGDNEVAGTFAALAGAGAGAALLAGRKLRRTKHMK